MRSVDRFLDLCEWLFRNAANAALLIILIAFTINLASRSFLGQGVAWAFPLSMVLFVWMVFLGFYAVYRKHKDVVVSVVVDALPDKGQQAVRIIADILMIALLLLILFEGPALIRRQVGMVEMVGIQRYWLSVPFFVSCGLIALHLANDMVHALRGHARPSRSVIEM